MSFVSGMGQLARDLAALVATRGQIPADDLPCALAGHAQLVDLLVTVHDDLTLRRQRREMPWHIAKLDVNPVAVLGRLLRHHPRPDVPAATTDLLVHRPDAEVGERWRQVLRYATVAGAAWRQSEPESLPRGSQAWSVMADVAALAQTVAYLVPTLAVSARNAQFEKEAQALEKASPNALWTAAVHVRNLANLGPLPLVGEPRRRSRWPVAVGGAVALADAEQRLGDFLRQTPQRPETIEQVAVAQARSLRKASPWLPDRQADAADRLSRALARAVSRPGSLTATFEADQRAVVQANQIQDFIQGNTKVVNEMRRHYWTWAAEVPVTLNGLVETVHLHVSQGRWLGRDLGRDGTWAPIQPGPAGRTHPELLRAVRGVARVLERDAPVLTSLTERRRPEPTRRLAPAHRLLDPGPPHRGTRPDLTESLPSWLGETRS